MVFDWRLKASTSVVSYGRKTDFRPRKEFSSRNIDHLLQIFAEMSPSLCGLPYLLNCIYEFGRLSQEKRADTIMENLNWVEWYLRLRI